MGNHAGFPARTRMTHVTGTGKYEQLLERCRGLGADSDGGGTSL